MKFGVREICNVVLKTNTARKIGNKVFYKGEPVIYFDSLKTSTLESAATTVYAQGGRGNARLMAWEGERTLTFTMEDALISPLGISILAGADLIEKNKSGLKHVTEIVPLEKTFKQTAEDDGNKIPGFTIKKSYIVTESSKDLTEADASTLDKDLISGTTYYNDGFAIRISKKPYIKWHKDNKCFVFFMKDGKIISEPYRTQQGKFWKGKDDSTGEYEYVIRILRGREYPQYYSEKSSIYGEDPENANESHSYQANLDTFNQNYAAADSLLVDYYTEVESNSYQIDISQDEFGGTYYLEADTLFRAENGIDVPAQFTIPNCKVQSNLTFTMGASGDPSTFTFTLDAFPGYTEWNKTKKILASIQVFDNEHDIASLHRHSTPASANDVAYQVDLDNLENIF